ncbi:MAG: hypothetical protein CMJ19_14020 [Phycisphaeraceae bacterium]|nr:hypothetical protein [Phycisphaeraceae bacterium]
MRRIGIHQVIYLLAVFSSVGVCFGQDQANATVEKGQTLLDVIIAGGLISILIWSMLFVVSAAALLLAVYCVHLMSRRYFNPSDLVETISELVKTKKWREAAETCQEFESIFSEAMEAILLNAAKGEEVASEAASKAITQRTRSISRQIGTLQMCANIAPMLGLLGTVTGMVSAFMGLGTAVGAEKASVLAISIAQALYTTTAGLLIAVPAIAVAHFCRNKLEHRTTELVQEVEETSEPIWKTIRKKKHADQD